MMDPSTWPSRDDQCPERGPALSHSVDGSPECEHCGQMIRPGEKSARNVDVPTVAFTPREVAKLKFLRWLRRKGRI